MPAHLTAARCAGVVEGVEMRALERESKCGRWRGNRNAGVRAGVKLRALECESECGR